ncbi:MAG TPA: aminotransferase class IV [Paenibacillaceae bacterium]
MIVLVNGQLKNREEAVISVFDHGFLYGMGLFETFRTYGGRPWLLERHAARLVRGCRMLGIAWEPDPERMRADIGRLLEANGLADGYIRWSVSAGEGEIGLTADPYLRPTEVIYAKALPPDGWPSSRPGKTLRLLRLPRSTPESPVRMKSFQYINNMLGKRELAESGAGPGTEGLFLDPQGHLCEGLVSNLFWLAGGTLHTPSTDTGALPGVTRDFIMDMARTSGVAVREGRYVPDDLRRAEEIFLTNSIQEIVPVTRVEDEEGKPLWSGGTGPATRRWMEEYRRMAEKGEAR